MLRDGGGLLRTDKPVGGEPPTTDRRGIIPLGADFRWKTEPEH